MKISYAQNYEDILIHRLFENKDKGVYVDVGAAHPRKDSVTKLFYDRGWSGINIEPNPLDHKKLTRQRPRDQNLWCAVTDTDGEVEYSFVPEDTKISFIGPCPCPETYMGKTIERSQIPGKTLSTILKDHDVGTVDFLKIDVEGAEMQVLKGADFNKMRPRLIIIEAVEIKGTEKVVAEWDPFLKDLGYDDVYFDGTNSYYVEAADTEGIQAFSYPLCARDHFIRAEHLRGSFLLKNLVKKMQFWHSKY